jgi:hypothetical protein
MVSAKRAVASASNLSAIQGAVLPAGVRSLDIFQPARTPA